MFLFLFVTINMFVPLEAVVEPSPPKSYKPSQDLWEAILVQQWVGSFDTAQQTQYILLLLYKYISLKNKVV